MFAHAVKRALRKNKTLRYGVPMLLLIVGGSFGLREFSQIRYDAVKIKIDPELEKKLKMNKVSLESEYESCSRTYLKLQLGCLLLTLLDCTILGPRNAGTWVQRGPVTTMLWLV
ncbi:cytochrome c oxidase assembly protein COX16 homolog, mitochondrial isoform 1-T1 [Megaptera novaeangliae]